MFKTDKRRFLFVVLVFGVFATMGFILYEQELFSGGFRSSSGHMTHVVILPSMIREFTNRRTQHLAITSSKTNDTEVCIARYEPSFIDNFNYIRAYNLSAALPYMERLRLNQRPLPTTDQSNVSVPIFVTACSSNHFRENMRLLENIETVVRPVYKDLKIVLFDLGLKKTGEIEQLSAACRCTVRKFPLSDAPAYFKHIKGCPWKPVVLQMVLKEYPFVMWMDSSVRFITGNLQPMFDKAMSSGIVLNLRNKTKRSPSIRQQTHQDTFQFLNEPPCLYDRELMIEAGLIVIYLKDDIFEGVLNPWTKCALIEECMWTTRPISEVLKCWQNETVQYHRCHRYDQSVLNILMKRLFHDVMDRHLVVECKYAYFRNPKRCKKYEGTSFYYLPG